MSEITPPPYNVVSHELPVLASDGRRMRRVAAVTAGGGFDDTLAAAYELKLAREWSVGVGRLVEDITGIVDLPPLRADNERIARQWIELIARLYVRAVSR